MTVIKQQDFIDSIYDALQYISYYHPVDFIRALKKAYEREQNVAAKNAIAQILVNSKMCAIGHRPLCQDTGIVTCFVKIGMQVQFDGDMTVAEMVNEGTRRAYTDPNNPLRKSVLTDPIGARVNTKDNTPAVTHIAIPAIFAPRWTRWMFFWKRTWSLRSTQVPFPEATAARPIPLPCCFAELQRRAVV